MYKSFVGFTFLSDEIGFFRDLLSKRMRYFEIFPPFHSLSRFPTVRFVPDGFAKFIEKLNSLRGCPNVNALGDEQNDDSNRIFHYYVDLILIIKALNELSNWGFTMISNRQLENIVIASYTSNLQNNYFILSDCVKEIMREGDNSNVKIRKCLVEIYETGHQLEKKYGDNFKDDLFLEKVKEIKSKYHIK